MKKLRIFAFITAAALLFAAGCDNPAGDDNQQDNNNQNIDEQPVQTEWTLTVGGAEYATLGSAINWVNEKTVEQASTFTLVITKNLNAAPRTIVGSETAKTVIIKPPDSVDDAPIEPFTISLSSSSSSQGSLFTVENGVILIVKAGITLKGQATNTAPLVTTAGSFTLEAGAVIQDNSNTANGSRGGGIFVDEGGEAVVQGKITGCYAGSGGAAYAVGSLTLSGSAYTSGNLAGTGKGAGVYNAGTVTVKDSAVIAETSGLYVADGKTIVVEGTLTPDANTVLSEEKSFTLVVQAPTQDEPFLIDDSDNGALFTISSETGAPLLPAAVSRAPEIAACLTNNVSTFTISWKRAALATQYEIWYGTSDIFSSAAKFATEPTAPPEPSAPFVLTGLASGTYYVWVTAKNAAGTSAPSPRSEAVENADPIRADMWGKYDSGFGMGEGTGDIYYLIPETNRLLYGTYTDAPTTGYGFRGDIVYHKSFGTETTGGALTTTGLCGVIIIKFDGRKYPGVPNDCEYYGIYYWGWGHIEPENRKILFLANAWPIAGQDAPRMNTPTLKDAQRIFTADNRRKYLMGNVMPQTKVEEED